MSTPTTPKTFEHLPSKTEEDNLFFPVVGSTTLNFTQNLLIVNRENCRTSPSSSQQCSQLVLEEPCWWSTPTLTSRCVLQISQPNELFLMPLTLVLVLFWARLEKTKSILLLMQTPSLREPIFHCGERMPSNYLVTQIPSCISIWPTFHPPDWSPIPTVAASHGQCQPPFDVMGLQYLRWRVTVTHCTMNVWRHVNTIMIIVWKLLKQNICTVSC